MKVNVILENNIVIVPTTEEHLDDIVEIDEEYSTKPWGKSLFIAELSHRFSYNFTMIYFNNVAGFASFWYICDVIELNNFAIKRIFRNKGLGRKFLKFIIKVSLFLKAKKIFLEVKEDNLIAINLYESENFNRIGLRNNYYSDGKNAILMERLL